MKLNIQNEWGVLKSVAVCRGTFIPECEGYSEPDIDWDKAVPFMWDKSLLLRQQDEFFSLLSRYEVSVNFIEPNPEYRWQMYVRDSGFVINDKFYFSTNRNYKIRNGEYKAAVDSLGLTSSQILEIPEPIEGGDVLVAGDQGIFVGNASRSSIEGIRSLSEKVENVRSFPLSKDIMHLDSNLTLLPNNIALCYLPVFDSESKQLLISNYDCIPITDAELHVLGTNVFVINPETVVVEARCRRIRDELIKRGLKVELQSYSEPINLNGSFRCTTMPLERQ